ncbi:Not1 N-terminal domain, CCR4-Not complex component-domain-containing protein [Cladochytrium replicatum]|nr:Not1 N-terminal domain, CCR4-Not complex component-domain-containing protein [Cladochytrium replicatum]
MATNRKLQTEIEKVLKKVQEGVEIFEGIFEKIQITTNATQKEKFESDLKKEIKKLQRCRDQIKTWLSSNEIKDKRVLLENRKLIEQQMEKFKACEKELKTKAYSKEGLSLPGKVDPHEKEKLELGQWVTETVDKLATQVDAFEAEQESLQPTVKKTRKLDPAKQERLTQIDHHLERHKFHMGKLEVVLRMLENGNLTVDKVRAIRDDINFYVESNQDPEFTEDEGIYDDLNLEEAELYGFANDDDKDSSTGSIEPETPPREKEHVPPLEKEESKKKLSRDDTNDVTSPSKLALKKAEKPATPAKSLSQGPGTAVPYATPAVKKASLPTPTPAPAPTPAPSRSMDQTTTPAIRYAAAAASSSAHAEEKSMPSKVRIVATPSIMNVAPPQQSAGSVSLSNSTPTMINAPQPQPPNGTPGSSKLKAAVVPAPNADGMGPLRAANAQGRQNVVSPTAASEGQKEEAQPVPQASEDNRLPPSLADLVASFEATKERSIKMKEDLPFLQIMLDSAFQNLPEPADAERPKYYMPKNPYPIPSYYPQHPMPQYENPMLFEKFDIDTLFFIFYYQQGTFQQYLAARELKRQSWRFHKKYLTWFQRHEEPKAITDEYEQGTYIYFDYEGAWCQRKKCEFRFEYRYLEDTEL